MAGAGFVPPLLQAMLYGRQSPREIPSGLLWLLLLVGLYECPAMMPTMLLVAIAISGVRTNK